MISRIAPLAALAAISPATLTAVVLILTGSKPTKLLIALYAGGLVASLAIGYAIVVALEGSGAFTGSGPRHLSPGIDVAAGSVALLVAAWLAPRSAARRKQRRAARRPGRPDREGWSQRLVGRGSPGLTFVIGMALNLPSGLYLIALKDVAAKHPSDAAALAALVAFNLVMLAPIEVPLVASLVDRERTLTRLGSVSAWLDDHGRQVVTGVAAVAGVYLLVRGVIGL